MRAADEPATTAERRSLLREEYEDARAAIFGWLEELDLIPALRVATPPGKQFLVDRLETDLRLLDRLEADLEGYEIEDALLLDDDEEEEEDDRDLEV